MWKTLRMALLLTILMLTSSQLCADQAMPFCDTPIGATATGEAYLVSLPGSNAVVYGLCAQPDAVGLKDLFRISIPPELDIRDLIGKVCKITARAIVYEQGEKRFKRFLISKIEPLKLQSKTDKTIIFLGTVVSMDECFLLLTVRVDKAIEGKIENTVLGIRMTDLAGSGIETNQQYKIEALLDGGSQFIPYRWTRQETPNKSAGGDEKPAPQR